MLSYRNENINLYVHINVLNLSLILTSVGAEYIYIYAYSWSYIWRINIKPISGAGKKPFLESNQASHNFFLRVLNKQDQQD